MKYRFSKSSLTCADIETASGLSRGSIKQLSIHPDGTLDIDVTSLTLAQKDKIATLIGSTKVIENPMEVGVIG